MPDAVWPSAWRTSYSSTSCCDASVTCPGIPPAALPSPRIWPSIPRSASCRTPAGKHILRDHAARLGNFWVDVTRAVLYILLPLSLPAALILGSQGVLQTFDDYRHITTLEGAKQTIALGPVASQESIKLVSSDGGGFFNANSAHPYENPSPVVNLLEMFLILAIPAAFTYTFGEAVKDRRQGWTLLAVMLILFVLRHRDRHGL